MLIFYYSGPNFYLLVGKFFREVDSLRRAPYSRRKTVISRTVAKQNWKQESFAQMSFNYIDQA